MAKAKVRQPKDFNHMDVKDRSITDPDGFAQQEAGVPLNTEYPKHLHKFAGINLPHEFVEVQDAADEADKRRQGWMSAKDADAVGHKAQAKLASASTSAPAGLATHVRPKRATKKAPVKATATKAAAAAKA